MLDTIELTGVVDYDGECEHSHEAFGTTATVGGRCVACVVEGMPAMIGVLLAHGGSQELYRGAAYADHGMKEYSTWTPAEAPTIEVGGVNLLRRLYELDGQLVHLRLDAT